MTIGKQDEHGGWVWEWPGGLRLVLPPRQSPRVERGDAVVSLHGVSLPQLSAELVELHSLTSERRLDAMPPESGAVYRTDTMSVSVVESDGVLMLHGPAVDNAAYRALELALMALADLVPYAAPEAEPPQPETVLQARRVLWDHAPHMLPEPAEVLGVLGALRRGEDWAPEAARLLLEGRYRGLSDLFWAHQGVEGAELEELRRNQAKLRRAPQPLVDALAALRLLLLGHVRGPDLAQEVLELYAPAQLAQDQPLAEQRFIGSGVNVPAYVTVNLEAVAPDQLSAALLTAHAMRQGLHLHGPIPEDDGTLEVTTYPVGPDSDPRSLMVRVSNWGSRRTWVWLESAPNAPQPQYLPGRVQLDPAPDGEGAPRRFVLAHSSRQLPEFVMALVRAHALLHPGGADDMHQALARGLVQVGYAGQRLHMMWGFPNRQDPAQPDLLAEPLEASGLPEGMLDSAVAGALAADQDAGNAHSRQVLAAALAGLARAGWLRGTPRAQGGDDD